MFIQLSLKAIDKTTPPDGRAELQALFEMQLDLGNLIRW